MYKILRVLIFGAFLISCSFSFGQTQKTIAPVLKGIRNTKKIIDSASFIVNKIEGAIAKVESSQAYKTLIDGYSVSFPFAVLPASGDKKYALIVNSVKLDPVTGMNLEVFMKVPVSGSRSLYFLADAVPVSSGGSISGDFKLYLLKSEDFKIGDGYILHMNGLGTGSADSTYITFNCKGFKDVTLNGSLKFNPQTIVKHAEEGSIRDTFALNYYVQADKLSNLVLKFSNVPSFQFKSLPGFKCTVNELTFDKSELRNAPSFKLPEWYLDSLQEKDSNIDRTLASSVLWEGVYIPQIKIEIPSKFKEGSTQVGDIIITSNDVIIDQYGITALTNAVGKPSLFNANIKSFKLDIDSIRINIIASKMSKAGIFGQMNFPVCKEDSKLDFGLCMSQRMNSDDLDYMGYAEWEREKPLVMNAFGLAQLNLTGCSIAFEYTNKQFYPSAAIDGSILVMPKSKSANTPLGSLNFEFGYLIISSKAPYIDLGGQSISFTASSGLSNVFNQAQGLVNSTQGAVNQVVGAGSALVQTTTNAVGGVVSQTTGTVNTTAQGVGLNSNISGNGITNGANNVGSQATGQLSQTGTNINNNLGNISNNINQVGGAIGVQQQNVQTNTVLNNGANQLSNSASTLSNGINSTATAINQKVSNASNTLITGFFKLKAGAESKLAKLPVSVTEVQLVKDQASGKIGLGMVINVKFQNSGGGDQESSNGFGGSAGFKIWAKRNPTSKRWGYAGFDLEKVKIYVDQSAFKLHGELTIFEDDPVYGKGFCGFIDLDVIDKINVKVGAIFGKVPSQDDLKMPQDSTTLLDKLATSNMSKSYAPEPPSEYRYWFVDAFAKITPGIPIAPGVEINSFTGGLYYHMKMFNSVPPGMIPTKVDCKTASGRTFYPTDTLGLGLLAGIGLQSMGGGNAFNGNINFGMQFSTKGGLVSIATWGDVAFLTLDFNVPGLAEVGNAMSGPLNSKTKSTSSATPPKKNSSIVANWFVEFDIPNKTLVGDFNVYFDLLGGLVKGVHDNNRAGSISIFASPKKWYVYMGKPSDMIGLEFLGLARTQSYLCLGSELPVPAIAPMPSEIENRISIDYNLLSMGSGLSFGSRLEVGGYPHISLGLCSAKIGLRFFIKAGFDILLCKSNSPVYCLGVGNRGFDNWYATGQAYVYGGATLHAKFDCGFYGDDFDFMGAFVSAYLFAQLPHPTYMKGSVAIGFVFLGHRFKESFSLEFGDQCATNNDSISVKFINNITPQNNATDIRVSDKIKVDFNNAIEYFTFKVNNENFRAYIPDSTSMLLYTKNGSTKTPIPFKYDFSPDRMNLTITPLRVLPENSEVYFTINVAMQKNVGGTWYYSKAVESQTVKFNTSNEPIALSPSDVQYAYPLPGMKNFYKDESTKGFIKLSAVPNKPMKVKPGYVFDVAIFENTVEIDRVKNIKVSTSITGNNFEFDIPNRRFETGKLYKLKLLKAPLFTNSTQGSTTTGNVTIGTLPGYNQDSVILEYNFTTSQYATYRDKMTYYSSSYIDIFNGVSQVNLSINKAKNSGAIIESLSEYEMDGYFVQSIQTAPELIQIGNIIPDGTFSAGLNTSKLDTEKSFKKLPNGSIVGVSNVLDQMNTLIKEANLTCLVGGGCDASQVVQFKLPAGKLTVPIGYYLPGVTLPTSEYSVIVNLSNPLTIPSN